MCHPGRKRRPHPNRCRVPPLIVSPEVPREPTKETLESVPVASMVPPMLLMVVLPTTSTPPFVASMVPVLVLAPARPN